MARPGSDPRAALRERYDRIRSDLDSLGFNDPDKKYLVCFDGPVDEPTMLCGQSETGLADRGGAGSAKVASRPSSRRTS